MSPQQKVSAVKRGRGRPPKPSGSKSTLQEESEGEVLINLRTMNTWKVGIIFMFDKRPGRKIVPGKTHANISDLKLLYVHANPICFIH